MDEEQRTAEPPAPPKRGGMKKILVMVLPVLLIGAGAGWWFLRGSKAVAAEEEVHIEERGVVPLETFLVNLSDPGGNRFLKVTLQLVFKSEAEAKQVEDNAALIGHARSSILELLTEQQAAGLVTPEGKKKLKENITEQLAKLLTKQKVLDVLFSEFVVQF